MSTLELKKHKVTKEWIVANVKHYKWIRKGPTGDECVIGLTVPKAQLIHLGFNKNPPKGWLNELQTTSPITISIKAQKDFEAYITKNNRRYNSYLLSKATPVTNEEGYITYYLPYTPTEPKE